MMRKVFTLCAGLLMLFGACNKTYDLQGIVLGEEKGDFIAPLYNKGIEITYEEQNELHIKGNIPAFGLTWEQGVFKFKNDKLVNVMLVRPNASTPMSSIENIKRYMRENCGGAYTNYEKMAVTYGTDREKDCAGVIMLDTDKDKLLVAIGFHED